MLLAGAGVAASLTACGEPAPLVPRHELLPLLESAEFYGAADLPPARSDADGGFLYLPSGRSVSFAFRLPRGCALAIDRLSRRDARGTSLSIELERDRRAKRELARLAPSSEPVRVDLPGASSIARLTLTAEPAEGGFALFDPVVECPEEPGPGPESGAATSASAQRPNLVVYLIDTLRRDRLGTYGYDKPVSPRLDAFAESAWVFDDAVAQSPWTRASVASIFTGLEPHQHGVEDRLDSLTGEHLTLAELLSASGYSTAAVITNGNVGSKFGFSQGFDHFSRSRNAQSESSGVTRRALDLLESGALEEPFLLYLHSMDPHAPYDPPAEERERFAPGVEVAERGTMDVLKQLKTGRRTLHDETLADIEALYDAEIAANDASFGRFLDGLDRLGFAERSVITVVSDHGEEFWEHGSWGHGHQLYAEVLASPLIVREPGQERGGRVAALAQHVDLLPTLLDYAGVPAPDGLPGRSLRSAAERPASAYVRVDLDKRVGASLIEGRFKLVVPRSRHLGSAPLLFDRLEDPEEMVDLAAERPVVVAYLSSLVRQRELEQGANLAAGTAELDEDLRRELEALGYLQ